MSAIEQQTARLSARLGELFPAGVLTAEFSGAGDETTLLATEAQCVAEAVLKRRREFAAGRACARLLMARFGNADFALLAAADRQPLWPDALVGSITHTEDFCAAAIAESAGFSGVGIDSEVSGSVHAALRERICTPTEMNWLKSLEENQRGAAATLLFSAKEAFYKAQYPMTRQRLNFQDATIEVQWGSTRGSFAVHAPSAVAFDRSELQGRYLFHERFVTTGLALR